MHKIMIIDDDAELRENLVEILTTEGYQTETAATVDQAVEKLKTCDFQIILLDFMMPGMDGIEGLSLIKRVNPMAKIIMITAFATIDNAVHAIKKGANDFVTKPFQISELLMLIKQLIEEFRFEAGMKKLALEETLASLSNAIRRNIIKLLHINGGMRLMQITRDIEISDHTKVVFHLKSLREAGIIQQTEDKTYLLTREGAKLLECLSLLEKYLQDPT